MENLVKENCIVWTESDDLKTLISLQNIEFHNKTCFYVGSDIKFDKKIDWEIVNVLDDRMNDTNITASTLLSNNNNTLFVFPEVTIFYDLLKNSPENLMTDDFFLILDKCEKHCTIYCEIFEIFPLSCNVKGFVSTCERKLRDTIIRLKNILNVKIVGMNDFPKQKHVKIKEYNGQQIKESSREVNKFYEDTIQKLKSLKLEQQTLILNSIREIKAQLGSWYAGKVGSFYYSGLQNIRNDDPSIIPAEERHPKISCLLELLNQFKADNGIKNTEETSSNNFNIFIIVKSRIMASLLNSVVEGSEILRDSMNNTDNFDYKSNVFIACDLSSIDL
jgi:hypothetical protein